MWLFLERSPVSGPRWMEGDEARVQSLDRWKAEPDGQMLSSSLPFRSLLLTYCNLECSQFYVVNQSTLAASTQPISSTLTIVKEIFRVKGRRSKDAGSAKCEPSTRCGCGWLVTPSINNIDSSLQNSGSGHLARGHLPSAALFRVKWSLQRCRAVKVDNDTGPLVSMFQWFQWFTLHHSDIITTEDTAAMVHRFYVLCPHLINLVKCCWVNSGIIY